MVMILIGLSLIVAGVIGTLVTLHQRRDRARADIDVESCLANLDRLRALRDSGLLDAPPRPELDALTRQAAQRLQAPFALMSLVDVDRQVFASQFGLDACWAIGARRRSTTPSASTSSPGTRPSRSRTRPRKRGSARALATTLLGVRAYLGVPVRSCDGHALGSFCVVDDKPRHWKPEDRQVLEELAESAMAYASATN